MMNVFLLQETKNLGQYWSFLKSSDFEMLAIFLSLKIPGVQKLRAWRTFGVGFTWNAPWPEGQITS